MTLTHHRPVQPGMIPHRSWLRRRAIARFEMGAVAAYHLLVAFTLLAAPREQIMTAGTVIIFGTIPLVVWACWFAATGIVAAMATYRVTETRRILVWCGVFPLGLAWIYGFADAVRQGHGNALGVIVWSFLLLWWLTLAVRLHIGGPGTQWGPQWDGG